MDIDSIIDHQAWIDIEIFSSWTKPNLDDFGSLQGIFFPVKGSLFWREAWAKARNSESNGW